MSNGFNSLLNRFRDLQRALTRAPVAPDKHQSVWYTGMPVDPADFGRQLTRLQSSIERANAPDIVTQPAQK
ncbi:MAG TPA: hypothetical protein VHB50_10940 [Bryobacteraceae bacterium]|nr:hypothetical protein [Bryobacteraceae bacterium]